MYPVIASLTTIHAGHLTDKFISVPEVEVRNEKVLNTFGQFVKPNCGFRDGTTQKVWAL